VSWNGGCGQRLQAVDERRVRETFQLIFKKRTLRRTRPLHKDARFLQSLLLSRLLLRLPAPSLADRVVVQARSIVVSLPWRLVLPTTNGRRLPSYKRTLLERMPAPRSSVRRRRGVPEGSGYRRQRRSGDARGEGRADGPDPAHLVASPCLLTGPPSDSPTWGTCNTPSVAAM